MQIHHIGWAVRSLLENHRYFGDQLGLPFVGDECFPTLKVAFFDAGGCLIELLEATDDADEVAVFVDRHGEGIHHIAYAVPDVEAALATACGRGLQLIDERPRPGARGTRIGFADPGRPDGVLVEYVQLP